MKLGYICAAGINIEKQSDHIRILRQNRFNDNRLKLSLHLGYGGPIGIGHVVKIVNYYRSEKLPEIEDYLCVVDTIQPLFQYNANEFINLLLSQAKSNFQSIFGNDLISHGQKYFLIQNTGICSLGIFKSTFPTRLSVNNYNKLYLQVNEKKNLSLPVTDIRFYDQKYILDREIVNGINKILTSTNEVVFTVGLTRSFRPRYSSISQPVHWLQINNIYPIDSPYWEVWEID